MFPKKSPLARRRSSGRSLESRAHANRTFAKKRREWISPFCTQCKMLCFDPTNNCVDNGPSGGRIPLISNQTLRDTMDESVRVARILGDIWFQPVEATVSDPCNPPNDLYAPVLMRIGLAKQQATRFFGGSALPVNPMACGGIPALPGPQEPDVNADFSEVKWFHQWTHTFAKQGRFGVQAAGAAPCCSKVSTQGLLSNIFTDGTGTIEIGTDCEPCGDPVPCIPSFEVSTFMPWHLHLDWKRPVNLRDNDELSLFLGWSRLGFCDDIDSMEQTVLTAWGGVRLLIEK